MEKAIARMINNDIFSIKNEYEIHVKGDFDPKWYKEDYLKNLYNKYKFLVNFLFKFKMNKEIREMLCKMRYAVKNIYSEATIEKIEALQKEKIEKEDLKDIREYLTSEISVEAGKELRYLEEITEKENPAEEEKRWIKTSFEKWDMLFKIIKKRYFEKSEIRRSVERIHLNLIESIRCIDESKKIQTYDQIYFYLYQLNFAECDIKEIKKFEEFFSLTRDEALAIIKNKNVLDYEIGTNEKGKEILKLVLSDRIEKIFFIID